MVPEWAFVFTLAMWGNLHRNALSGLEVCPYNVRLEVHPKGTACFGDHRQYPDVAFQAS